MEKDNLYDWMNGFGLKDEPIPVKWWQKVEEYIQHLHPNRKFQIVEAERYNENMDSDEEFRNTFIDEESTWSVVYVLAEAAPDDDTEYGYVQIYQTMQWLNYWYDHRHRKEKLLQIKSKMK